MSFYKAGLNCTRLQVCYCGFCNSIHHGPYGVLFSYPTPFKLSVQLMDYYFNEFGYDICDTKIAHHLDVALCITTKELSDIWKKELGI